MDAEQLKDEFHAGRIDGERLIEVIAAQQRLLQQMQEKLDAAQRRIEELEKQQGGPTAKVEEPYSVRSEERRQEARGKKRRRKSSRRRGRKHSAEKVAQAERTEQVFPEDVPPEECTLSHTRPVWRLENGRAVLLAYEVYRGPGGHYGQVPGVIGRSEFGIEIILAVAYQVYVTGLSFEQVCLQLEFFQNLSVRKSQIDALLKRLARHWEEEFETLCTLLAYSAIVHADETGWSLNSVWAFLSEKARLLLFGVPKDAATLQAILDPAVFEGLLISDDAAVYANFTYAQKCWAHLLRKAIKLTLLAPDNEQYRRFADRLLEIYRTACRVKRDRRLSDAGRARKVAELDDEVLELCAQTWAAELPPSEGPENDYRLLVNELMRLMLNQQLFVFVTATAAETPCGETLPASGTNNEAERTLRSPAETRKMGRTNKTRAGARTRTVNVSVLESLRLYLPDPTFWGLVEEVSRWLETGRSCFAALLGQLDLPPPSESVLDAVLPLPGG